MELRKKDSYFELFLSGQKFVLDPPDFRKEPPPLILSNPVLKVNIDKIFNSAGEYNLGEIYFYGFDDGKAISYFFKSYEGNVLYLPDDLSSETFKKLKMFKIKIDAFIVLNNLKEELVKEFKPRVVFTLRAINLAKFKIEKVNKLIKLNLNKVENIIYLLQ